MTEHNSKVFGPTISQMLIDARLNPMDLETLIELAINEDLDGGVVGAAVLVALAAGPG